MPAAFALGGPVLGNPVLATFAALGSFAMLLLVDFGGSIRNRLQCQAALAVACMALIALGTLASRDHVAGRGADRRCWRSGCCSPAW